MKRKVSPKEVKKIFHSKKEFHKIAAKSSVEEKIKTLIELQKIDLKSNPKNKDKIVWKII